MLTEQLWLNKAFDVIAAIERYLLTKSQPWFQDFMTDPNADCTFVISAALATILSDPNELAALQAFLPRKWRDTPFEDVWLSLRQMPESYRQCYAAAWEDVLVLIKSDAYRRLILSATLFKKHHQDRQSASHSRWLQVFRAELLYPRLTQQLYRYFAPKRTLMNPAQREHVCLSSIADFLTAPEVLGPLASGAQLPPPLFDRRALTGHVWREVDRVPALALPLLQLAEYFAFDSKRLDAYVKQAALSRAACVQQGDVTTAALEAVAPLSSALNQLDPVIWPRTSVMTSYHNLVVLRACNPDAEQVERWLTERALGWVMPASEQEQLVTMQANSRRLIGELNRLTSLQARCLVSMSQHIDQSIAQIITRLQCLSSLSYLTTIAAIGCQREGYKAALLMAAKAIFVRDPQYDSLNNPEAQLNQALRVIHQDFCRQVFRTPSLSQTFTQWLVGILDYFLCGVASACWRHDEAAIHEPADAKKMSERTFQHLTLGLTQALKQVFLSHEAPPCQITAVPLNSSVHCQRGRITPSTPNQDGVLSRKINRVYSRAIL